jgi:hypothetical protein
MRVKKREIENAIQELNNVIADIAIYADSLKVVRETLEKFLYVPERGEKVRCIDCKNCIEDGGLYICLLKNGDANPPRLSVDPYVEEECGDFEDDSLE